MHQETKDIRWLICAVSSFRLFPLDKMKIKHLVFSGDENEQDPKRQQLTHFFGAKRRSGTTQPPLSKEKVWVASTKR